MKWMPMLAALAAGAALNGCIMLPPPPHGPHPAMGCGPGGPGGPGGAPAPAQPFEAMPRPSRGPVCPAPEGGGPDAHRGPRPGDEAPPEAAAPR